MINPKDALVHSNYPYTKLSEEYQLKPEFFYAYHGAFETDSLEMDGNTYAMEELDGTVATDYKINLTFTMMGKTLEFTLSTIIKSTQKIMLRNSSTQ